MATSILDLMKQAAANVQINNPNGSSIMNQAMNLLSQQQAQKAREQEMMQKFLMQRQMKKEDFERQVEFGKMFKKQSNEEDILDKKYASMQKEEKDLYQLHDYVSNQIQDIRRTVDFIDTDAYRSAQKKIRQRMSTDSEFRKQMESLTRGFNSKQNPSANDIDKIADQVNKLILLDNMTDDEVSVINMIFNGIKGTTASNLKNRGIKAGAQMMKTALGNKGVNILQSPEALKQSFENLIPEYSQIYKTSFDSRADAVKDRPHQIYSITMNDAFNPQKFQNAQKNDSGDVGMMLKEAMDSGEDELSEDEQAYFDYGVSKGASEEEIMRELAKNRKGK